MFCWFFRLRISGAMDGDGALSRAVEKHIRHCTDCREFYDRCVSLADGLKGGAAISDDEIARRLSARIPRAIPYPQVKMQKVGIRLWPAAVAACIALIVLAGALFLTRYRDGRVSGGGEVGTEIQAVRNLVGGDFAGAWSGLVEKPLEDEMEKLQEDTESAVRFLVTCVAVDVTSDEINQRPE